MTYEKRKKRRSIKKKLRLSLIFFVLAYLIFRSAPMIFAGSLKTTLPKRDKLKEELQVEAVLIKDERVFVFEGEGNIDKKIDEGERVPVGIDIGNANFLKDVSNLEHELKRIENSIEIINSGKDIDSSQEENTEKIIERKKEVISEIQRQINTKDFKDRNIFSEELKFHNREATEIFQDKELLGLTLESLERERENLKEKINKNHVSYKTELSGIISYKIDGYENLFLPENLENYDYNTLEQLENEKSEEEINGFKIIDNFNWYLALKFEGKEDMQEYEEGNFINISFMDFDEVINGKVVKINKSQENGVIILHFRDYFQDYYNIRFSKVNVLKSIKEGFKIPKSTVIEKEDQKGVYIKDFNGIVKFRPINIIAEESQYFLVDMGRSGKIDLPNEKDSVRTIGKYDEIFLKPNNIKKGQIVN